MIELRNKKVAIIGLSRTGLATAKFLDKLAKKVIVSDVKGKKQLEKEIEDLINTNVEFELNGHGEKCLAADMIVTSPGVPLDLPFFIEARKRGIEIISEIELAYHFTEAKIIAITGTNGKTTTTSLIGEILSNADIAKVRVAGNIGKPLIEEIENLSKDDFLVVEISSFQLETIKDFKPHISLYLNFTPDHLDRHKNIENYWSAKKRIFENQNSSDYAIVNANDSEVMRAVQDFPGVIYKIKDSNDTGLDKGIYISSENIILKHKDKEIPILKINEIPLMGFHNVQNVAFSAMASYLAGVSIDIIKETVINFKASAHRMEVINDYDEFLIIDDSKATNPAAAIKALESISKPIVLIAGGQDRDANFDELLELINKKVKFLVLIGETANKLKEGALKLGFDNINIHIAKDMREAVKIAYENLESDNCLLLSPACPSWDMYSSYKERGKRFQEALNLLNLN
ncbi:UDP-N-acetylmuramoyl-L-alanine--D-glutamate ligase [Natronospora cellulosivora (SeqCode)]